jgi:hypothetical protein
MSIVVNLSSLSTDQVDSINTDLVLAIERNKYNAFAKIENIFAFSLNHDNTVSIPFAYALQELNLNRQLVIWAIALFFCFCPENGCSCFFDRRKTP